MTRKKAFSYLLNFIFALAVYFLLQTLIAQGVLGRYQVRLLVLICINAILAVSLNLSTGLLGELTLGHAGFMAIGAYTSALLTLHADFASGIPSWYFFFSLICAAIMAGIFGFIVGIPALRLRGDYLAIITLAFGEIIRVLIRSFKFTGGAVGLNGIEPLANFTNTYGILVIAIYVIYALIRSWQGRSIIAIREDEIAAEASGINTTKYKALAFVISAAFAGIAGGLYAHFQGVITPQEFDYNYSIDIMVMVVLGGMGSLTGSVISATIITLLPELLRGFAGYRTLIYAVILIVLMIYRPSGLLGQKELSQNFILNFFHRTKKPEKAKLPAGVGGSGAQAKENLTSLGTPERTSQEIVRKGKGEASSSDISAPGRRDKGER